MNLNTILASIKECNAWPRIRVMGCNIAQDTLVGITVAYPQP